MNKITQSVEVVAAPWRQSVYYEDAETWTFIFWSEDHPFYPQFKRLDLTVVLELACGHGRHSEIVAGRSGQLTLMDVHGMDNNMRKDLVPREAPPGTGNDPARAKKRADSILRSLGA